MTYRFFPILILLLVLSACGIRKLERKGIYKETDASKYEAYLNDSTVQIIDVRTSKEYQKSHIAGAKNASYISGHFEDLVDSLHLDPSRTTLIYCETQHRSLFAAKKLYKKGFSTIVDLDKGMIHWRKMNYPYISDSTATE
jgi:rhodanese-related sulfurtransferase